MRDRGRIVYSSGNPSGGSGEKDAARIGNGGLSVEHRFAINGKWCECYVEPSRCEIVELILEDHLGVTAVLADGRKRTNVTILSI